MSSMLRFVGLDVHKARPASLPHRRRGQSANQRTGSVGVALEAASRTAILYVGSRAEEANGVQCAGRATDVFRDGDDYGPDGRNEGGI